MDTVTDNTERSRLELPVDGEVGAFVDYRLEGTTMELVHTETVEGFEGRGLAGRLVAGVMEQIAARCLSLRPSCSYVQSWLKKHREHLGLVPDAIRTELGLL